MRRWMAAATLVGLLAGCNTERDPNLEGLALAWAEQATAERWRYARFVTRCDGDTLAECKLAPPWRSRRLFKSGGTLPEPDASGPTYWVHEWLNEQTPSDAARAVMNAGNDLPLRPPRVQPMADLDALRGSQSQAWKAPAGVIEGRIASDNAVRVAVLDTVPHGAARVDTREGVSPHGLDMARAVQQGACGASVACPVSVVTELALDLIPGRVGGSRPGDPALGGAYGDPGSVAVAIHKATERWLAEDDSSRLVLVIPAGWRAAADDPGSEAALLALQQARCFGALAVAAYGNAEDGAADAGRVPRGPLCPACFADAEVPGCDATTGPVWPAAGVQALPSGALGRLPSGRDPGAIEPAVYGYGAQVRPSGGALAWTGSSAGAALAAAGLAVTWAGLEATGVAGADAALGAAEAIAGESGGFLAPCKAAGQGCETGRLEGAQVPAGPCSGGLCYEAEAAGAAGLARDVGVAARPLCDVCVLSGDTLVLAAGALPGAEPDEVVRAAALKVLRTDGKVDRFALALDGVTRAELATDPLEVVVPGVLEAGAIRSVELVGLLEWADPDRDVATPRVRSLREAVALTP